MAKFTDYTQKTKPADADLLLIHDNAGAANKKTPFSGVWSWILDKLASAVISQLETTNKRIIPAINELNSNYGKIPEGVFDLKNPPQYNMFVAGAGSTNIPPRLDGNACICFQQFPRDENYNVLICFSFGADKIAIQRRRDADIWTDWKYFTAN